MTRTKTIVPRSARHRLALILLVACAAPHTDEPEDRDVGGAVTSEDEVVTGETRAPDGLSLVYDVRGSGEVALVFVHCWACDRSFWREQLDAFADEYRVVSLDLGGHGDSGRERDEWTIEGLARDVLAVADALALERLVLVGHSMGGPVSLAAAPLLGDRLEAVVCIDTLHSVERQPDAATVEPFLESLRTDYEGAMSEAVRGMTSDAGDPALTEWILARALAADRSAVIALAADFPNVDFQLALAGTGVPIRCINAAPRPPVGPATDVEANRRFADFDAVLMEDVGHYLMIERPAELNRLLGDLLDELLGG